MKTALIVDANYLMIVIRRHYDLRLFTPKTLERLALLVGDNQMPEPAYLVTAILPFQEKVFRNQAKALTQSGWQVKGLIWASETNTEERALEESALLGYVVGKIVANETQRLVLVSGGEDLVPVMQSVQKESRTELILVAHSRKLPLSLIAAADQLWLLDSPTRETAEAVYQTDRVNRVGIWDRITNLVEVNT